MKVSIHLSSWIRNKSKCGYLTKGYNRLLFYISWCQYNSFILAVCSFRFSKAIFFSISYSIFYYKNADEVFVDLRIYVHIFIVELFTAFKSKINLCGLILFKMINNFIYIFSRIYGDIDHCTTVFIRCFHENEKKVFFNPFKHFFYVARLLLISKQTLVDYNNYVITRVSPKSPLCNEIKLYLQKRIVTKTNLYKYVNVCL